MIEEKLKKPNCFVRVLIVLFCLGLAFMIVYNFICVEPAGVIKDGVFILLSILLILVLAESFDNFSIGRLISIKREIEVKKEENTRLERKNSELISHLISITNNQTQKQQSTNIFGDYYSDLPRNMQPKQEQNDNVQELIDRIGNSIVITDIEKKIKDELQEKNLDTSGETVKVLLRHLAGTQLILEFERVHSLIFGSQLYLLRALNTSNGIPESEVYAHFERVKQQFKDSFTNWAGETYLEFLYSRILITKDDQNNVHITNFGREYLTWITRNGIDENKPL